MRRREFLSASAAASAALLAPADEPPKKKVRVGVIGHTKRGDYGHALDVMWLKLPETEVVGVADADPTGLIAAKKKLKTETGFDDYKAMLKETKPQVVAVCPRHVDQHHDMILAAIDAGAEGVYCEKPFCRTPAEADAILAAAAKKKVKIAVAHRNPYHPAMPVVLKLIADGAIGKVLELRGRGKEDARGGALDLWVLGSHVANMASVIGGPPTACAGSLLRKGKPAVKADVTDGAEGVGPIAGDEVHARFEMTAGFPFFFDSIVNPDGKGAGFGLQVIGTKGVIDLRADREPLAHLIDGGPFTPSKEPRAWVPISSAGVGKPEPVATAAADLAAHLTAGRDLLAAMKDDRAPLCDGAAGATTVEMICGVFESHRLGGQRVTFPLKTRVHPLTLL
jgi:predicted dehydrogenase